MKYGMRKPSVKKSVSARTTGKINRSVKKAVNPTYGKKGMGMINDPKKAVYNKVYNKTTFSATDLAGSSSKNVSEQDQSQGAGGVEKVAMGCLGMGILMILIPFLMFSIWLFNL